jgi:hypothetical protein
MTTSSSTTTTTAATTATTATTTTAPVRLKKKMKQLVLKFRVEINSKVMKENWTMLKKHFLECQWLALRS